MNHVLANSGTFAQPTITSPSLSYLKGGTWKSFSNQAKTTMDGIRIRTPSTNGVYYLEYRTWNEGKSDYYPYVNSKDDDYAGSPGKPIQRLQIQAYRGDGTKLTSGIVVMYRAFVENKWLPWVSNADPQWMQAVQKKHNLGGTLDTAGSYAGLPGKNIAGIEIRVYAEGSMGDFSGGENEASMSYLVDSDWSTFNKSALASHIDGIKIQTNSNKDYYLSYKTQNEGKSDYYPAVSSLDNDYAGSPGKPIQKLNIRVLNRAGVSLTSGVIVMYRAFVENKWLPWVSNADPEWMRNVQSKYSLGGTLDTSSAYAGIEGKNISGIEIRIFEDNSANSGSGSFSGDEISISSRYMVDNTSNWKSFTSSVKSSHIDGVELKTSGQPFYFLYKTWNEGQPYYYPAVKSTDSDYAGSPGKPIQKLNIEVYSNDGTELTSGVVVMYRAYVDGRWLPWVSNADPEWMESVQAQYNLGGTLDVNGYCAGITGKNISGLEIRVFSGSTASIPGEDLPGTEVSANLQYLVGTTWKPFTGKITASHIDGIKIQTFTVKPYYLLYRTRNEGKDDYYPPVSSRENDYAGSPNKPIQRLNIEVYRNDGVKLTTGVVVMYRVYVDGKWLPWVSNADPEWMRSVQAKYDLGGILDTSGYYAGLPGKNIGGVEIRIFEENNTQIPPQKPTGKYKIIDVDFIPQMGKYPTGCESVSAVMALRHIGYTTSVDYFIDNCLSCAPYPFDPYVSFGGDPRSVHGFGCYAPVIKKALLQVLDTQKYEPQILSNIPLETLCKEYIDKNIPVILWATMSMKPPYISSRWECSNGRYVEWVAPEHCLLLVGYDDNHYIFNDPLVNKQTYYSKESVEAAYLGLHQQAVVIIKKKEAIEPEDSFDVKALEKVDRQFLVNSYNYSSYYNKLLQDSSTAVKIPSNISDFNILSCLQLIFLYFWEQKDFEKADMLYDEMITLRKLLPNYRSIYKEFLDSNGKFNMGYQYYAPGKKTTKIQFLAATYFDKETIKKMHQADDWMVFLANLIPGVGSYLSFMMSCMQDLEQNGGNGLRDLVLEEWFGKYSDKLVEEIFDLAGLPSFIKSGIDTLWSFGSTSYDTAGENRETYVKDGVTLQDGDSYIQLSLWYDMGVEEHQFRFYFRNGYPYVTGLPQYVTRWDNHKSELSVSKRNAQIFKKLGYVPSEKHAARGLYWQEILNTTNNFSD